MPIFNRFDICAAYDLLEQDYNTSGILQERPSCQRRNKGNGESVAIQLKRIGYQPRNFTCEDRENVQEIYNAAAERLGLPAPAHVHEWRGIFLNQETGEFFRECRICGASTLDEVGL